MRDCFKKTELWKLLGFAKYVEQKKNYDYVNFAKIGITIINETEDFKAITFKIKREEVNLKNFLKQITSIFICNNDSWFTEAYPELLEFVRNENYTELPSKYRFYMYLNNEGQKKMEIGHLIILTEGFVSSLFRRLVSC